MITTYSSFIYGHTVDDFSNYMTVDEGSGNVDVVIQNGRYSFGEYAEAVQLALNSILSNSYAVTIDRSTRKITISCDSNFSIDVTGTTNSAFDVMGFTTDRSGSNEYESDVGSGSIYYPQFMLQDYIDFEDNKKFLDGKVNESGSGKQEIVSFGLVKEMQCNIKFINDYEHELNSPIVNNQSGLSDARSFMDYCINKGSLEFLKDKNTTNYTKVLLQSTSKSGDGVAYLIKEMLPLIGYYETGTLTFREIV